jgi:putative ABC transport system permease protein
VITTHVPDYPLEIKFLDEDLEHLYGAEERISKVVAVAAVLAVFMSCLGILGLVSHAVRRRTREIGIRKTLGATVTGLARLMLVEFVVGVGLACLIAWPVGYVATSRWLESFAFAIPVTWSFYLFSGITTLAIAVATAGFHAVRAARANPVDALRYE